MSDKRGFLSGFVAAVLALVVMASLTLSAQAATLYITEYANAISQIGTTSPQILPAPPLRTQTVAISGGSTSSIAFGTGTKAVTLTCDIGCSIVIGTGTVAATTTSTLQQQQQTVTYGVVPGNVVAVIANTAGDLPGGGAGTTENVNLAQVAGTTTAVGNGTTNAGTQRVTISSDSTGTVIATQATAANLNAQVVGNAASGAADSGNPVKVGCAYTNNYTTLTNGQRGNCRMTTMGDLGSALVASGSSAQDANANGSGGLLFNGGQANISVAPVFLQVWPQDFNGSTWDREFTCPSTAAISVTAGNTTQLVALSGTTVIRVCSFVTSISLTGSAAFVYGTGANCGTGQTAITGAMNILTGSNINMSSGNGSLFRALAANALCLTAATGNVTGFVTYAQY